MPAQADHVSTYIKSKTVDPAEYLKQPTLIDREDPDQTARICRPTTIIHFQNKRETADTAERIELLLL